MLKSVRSFLNRVYQRQKSYREGRRVTVYEITHDAVGMRVTWLSPENERGEGSIKWLTVVSIFAFKRDLYSVDLICLCLNLNDNTAVEIAEDMNGWEALVTKLPEYLPGCKRFEEWFEVVAIPAFKPNITEIYQRAY